MRFFYFVGYFITSFDYLSSTSGGKYISGVVPVVDVGCEAFQFKRGKLTLNKPYTGSF